MRKRITRKRVTMLVTVSCPVWLTAQQARREVKHLVKDQAFWGHQGGRHISQPTEEISDHNFKLIGVGPVRKVR